MVWAVFDRTSYVEYYKSYEEASARCLELNEESKHTIWCERPKTYHIGLIKKPYWLDVEIN